MFFGVLFEKQLSFVGVYLPVFWWHSLGDTSLGDLGCLCDARMSSLNFQLTLGFNAQDSSKIDTENVWRGGH